MVKPLVVSLIVRNSAAEKAAYAEQFETMRGGQKFPGWIALGMFVPAEDGEPTCVEYRVRAVPDTHDYVEIARTSHLLGESMAGQHVDLPAPAPTSGGIPRYVFEKASQLQLLKAARDTVARGTAITTNLDAEARGLLAASEQRKPGRPPARGLPEKLRILADVEGAFEQDGSLDDVAARWHISRSGLRDLLAWARHDSSPRLFTSLGHGRRGGALTAEGRALLAEIVGKD